jgi:hypothetical protein
VSRNKYQANDKGTGQYQAHNQEGQYAALLKIMGAVFLALNADERSNSAEYHSSPRRFFLFVAHECSYSLG